MRHTFSANPLDRAERGRRSEAWISAAVDDERARFLVLRELSPLVARTANGACRLAWLYKAEVERLLDDNKCSVPQPLLLGLEDGVPHFVTPITAAEQEPAHTPDDTEFIDARTAAMRVSPEESGIIAQARSQLDWHTRHRFCSVCGSVTQAMRGGQLRQCPSCNAQHFPRTDPVVIMLTHLDDECILGMTRGRHTVGMYSCLAGFMDQGESIEEAVRREVFEESGLELKSVTYHSSQPWPFPSSLMIGCLAEAATTDIHYDREEMADVRWFSRGEVQQALKGEHPWLRVPGKIAIAHHLIKAWADHTEFTTE